MKRLFIIGNGFDLAHKIESKYSDFRKWFMKEYSTYLKEDLKFEDLVSPDIRKIGTDDHVASRVIKKLLDDACNLNSEESSQDMWNNLEYNLSKIDFLRWLVESDLYIEDIKRKTNRGEENIKQEILHSLMYVEEFLEECLEKWVDSLKIEGDKIKKFVTLLDTETQFFTFNYTKTLEKIYTVDIKKIKHIHIGGKNKYILGTKFDYNSSELQKLENKDSYFYSWYLKKFEKPTDKIIEQNMEYFNSLSKCTEIYSFGFSYADVDMVYIEKILSAIETNKIDWYFTSYDWDNEDSIDKYCKKINSFNLMKKEIKFKEFLND